MTQTPVKREWFDASFLAQIPVGKIDEIVALYASQLGAFQKVESSADGYLIAMERGTAPARISLSSEGKVTLLWFGPPEPAEPPTLDDSLKTLGGLPGKVSVAVFEGGKLRASLHPDEPLAVGSAFKLAVLAALSRQVYAGKHRWDEVHPLDPAWKSLPSGVLRDWPDRTPLTLATLANEMVSISDNTAADALLSISGREAVEKLAPRNRPFLSTREAFILKSKAQAPLLAKYRAANTAGRLELLAEVDKTPLPDVHEFLGGPIDLDIEWFFTASELCALMGQVADLPAMRINPGVAQSSDWTRVAFKGGSEPGLLNLTTALIGKNGSRYCVAATWNNAATLEEKDFYLPYRGILQALAKESAK